MLRRVPARRQLGLVADVQAQLLQLAGGEADNLAAAAELPGGIELVPEGIVVALYDLVQRAMRRADIAVAVGNSIRLPSRITAA